MTTLTLGRIGKLSSLTFGRRLTAPLDSTRLMEFLTHA